MKLIHTLRVALVAAVALLVLAAPGRAQGQFGVVDFQRCINESKARQQAAMDFDTLQKSLNAVLSKLNQPGIAFLTKPEITELFGLYEKTAPSDAEKKRIGELETKADQQIGAMKRLESTNPLNDDQKKQIQALADAQQIGVQSLREIQQAYQGKLEQKDGELSSNIAKIVKEAVAKVAKEKNLAMVFGADQVVYAQVDITEDVLKVVK